MSENSQDQIITGEKVTTPTKEEMATTLARLVGVGAPTTSSGSSVSPELLERIYTARTGHAPPEPGAYQVTKALLEEYGLTYDPRWDTSEIHGQNGGSTVTNRAYSRLLAAERGTPRCFVLNSTDAKQGNAWETDKQTRYSYDANVTGRAPFTDAGPGSLVLFYNTGSHSQDRMSFTATARVEYISPGWRGPWDAELADYQTLANPVPASHVQISGRNPQHAITEITWEQYQAIVEAGSGHKPQPEQVGVGRDIGGAQAAQHILEDFQPDTVEVVGDPVPARRTGTLEPEPERERRYSDDGQRVDGGVFEPRHGRTPSDRQRDKATEKRAVELAVKHLEAHGWRQTADRQAEGVGYDLDMSDGTRTIHLEVKGIRGPRTEFNLTSKEWWRAQTDPDFVLAAVTDALDPKKVRVNLITPEELVGADRVPTQYRVALRDRVQPVEVDAPSKHRGASFPAPALQALDPKSAATAQPSRTRPGAHLITERDI